MISLLLAALCGVNVYFTILDIQRHSPAWVLLFSVVAVCVTAVGAIKAADR